MKNGLITEKDTEGLQMTWGSHKAIVAMTEKLVKREGFGNIIADGVKKAAERIGKDFHNSAIHVGGEEVPAHSPSCIPLLTITYRLDATPARHTQKSALMRPRELRRQTTSKSIN